MEGEGLTIIVRVGAKEMTEEIGISRGITSPHIPDLIAEGISNEFVFRTFHNVVGADIWRLCVGIFGSIHLLCGKKTEVLAPEEAAEGSDVVSSFVGLAVHGAVESVGVFHYDGEFAVVQAHL